MKKLITGTLCLFILSPNLIVTVNAASNQTRSVIFQHSRAKKKITINTSQQKIRTSRRNSSINQHTKTKKTYKKNYLTFKDGKWTSTQTQYKAGESKTSVIEEERKKSVENRLSYRPKKTRINPEGKKTKPTVWYGMDNKDVIISRELRLKKK